MTRPIIFSPAMVQAIMDGRKTQTRRIYKKPLICPYGEPGDILYVRESWRPFSWDCQGYFCFEYKDGKTMNTDNGVFPDDEYKEEEFYIKLSDYLEARNCPKDEDGNFIDMDLPYRPSIHMPKSAARIWLQVESVRVERLQDITEEDAKAEGVELINSDKLFYKDYLGLLSARPNARTSFFSLWQSIHGPYSWNENPYVWVVEFKVLSTTGKRRSMSASLSNQVL